MRGDRASWICRASSLSRRKSALPYDPLDRVLPSPVSVRASSLASCPRRHVDAVAWQVALSLEGFQKKRFIDFLDAVPDGRELSRQHHKPVSPTKGCILADGAAPCCRSRGQPPNHDLGIHLLARDSRNACQWCRRQRVGVLGTKVFHLFTALD